MQKMQQSAKALCLTSGCLLHDQCDSEYLLFIRSGLMMDDVC